MKITSLEMAYSIRESFPLLAINSNEDNYCIYDIFEEPNPEGLAIL